MNRFRMSLSRSGWIPGDFRGRLTDKASSMKGTKHWRLAPLFQGCWSSWPGHLLKQIMTGAMSGREKERFKYFKLKISIRHSSGDRKKLDKHIYIRWGFGNGNRDMIEQVHIRNLIPPKNWKQRLEPIFVTNIHSNIIRSSLKVKTTYMYIGG